MNMESIFERLEKEMPGYYVQIIPAFLCAGALSLAAELLKTEVDSIFRIPLYILVFGATNYLFYKSLLRTISQVQMNQAIKERNVDEFLREGKSAWMIQVIFLIVMILLNAILYYVWVVLHDRIASVLLLLLLTIQYFKGIQSKIQFIVFLRAIKQLK